MTDILTDALARRLRSFDWFYEYSDDHSVFKKEQAKLQKMRKDFEQNPLDINNQVLEHLIQRKIDEHDARAIRFLEGVIAKQINKKENETTA